MFNKRVYPDEIANFLINNTEAATEKDREAPDTEPESDTEFFTVSTTQPTIDRDQSRVRIRAVTGEQATHTAIAEYCQSSAWTIRAKN